MLDNLVLHCAVIARQTPESDRLVQWLIEQHPECLEVRSVEGYTPLSLAFVLRKTGYAKMLIAARANQTTRDSEGCNLLHNLLMPRGQACMKGETIAPLIELIDKSLISQILTQRAGEKSMTPFAKWLEAANGSWRVTSFNGENRNALDPASVAKLVLDLAAPTNQKHLELLSASGNTPVHEAVKAMCPAALEAMLDRRPDLLYRENATGSTPLELTVDLWVNKITREEPKLAFLNGRDDRWTNVSARPGWHFLPHADFRGTVEKMYDICQARAQNNPGKRKLVGLHEANEVAKRLASKQVVDRHHFSNYHNAGDRKQDEVSEWSKLGWATQVNE